MKPAARGLWFVFFLFAGVLAVAGVSRFVGQRTPAEAGLIPWQTDYAAARELAAKEKRPVLVYFTADWCGYCRKLEGDAWSNPQVAAAVRDGYVPVKVDIDKSPDLAKQFRVDGVPRVDVVPADGPTATLLEGYAPAADVLARVKQKR